MALSQHHLSPKDPRILPFSPRRRPPGRLWRWFGALGGPVAWLVQRVAFGALASPACRSAVLSEIVITAVTALIAAAATGVSWRTWDASRGPADEDTTGTLGQTSFWALGGLFLGFVFLVAVLVTGGITIAFSTTCR